MRNRYFQKNGRVLSVSIGFFNFDEIREYLLNLKAIKQVLELDLNEKNGDIIKVKASARLVTCEDESRFEDNDFQSYV